MVLIKVIEMSQQKERYSKEKNIRKELRFLLPPLKLSVIEEGRHIQEPGFKQLSTT